MQTTLVQQAGDTTCSEEIRSNVAVTPFDLMVGAGFVNASVCEAARDLSRYHSESGEFTLRRLGLITDGLIKVSANLCQNVNAGFMTFEQACVCLRNVNDLGRNSVADALELLLFLKRKRFFMAQIRLGLRPLMKAPRLIAHNAPQIDPAEHGAYNHLTQSMLDCHLYANLETVCREKLALAVRHNGDGHSEVLQDLTDLAAALCGAHKFDECEVVISVIVNWLENQFHAPKLEMYLSMLAALHVRNHKFLEAEALLERALELQGETRNEQMSETLRTLAWLQFKQGRDFDARKVFSAVYLHDSGSGARTAAGAEA